MQRIRCAVTFLFACGIVAFNIPSRAAEPLSPAPASPLSPASQAAEGRWDEISDRVVFLTRSLATVETSLAAVDLQVRQTGYKASSRADAAGRAAKGNELMNRNLGMPTSIDWKDFYGRTAQRFFYHPKDAHTYYINPHPIADRPPQFDYIYKANQQAKRQAEADVAALGGKIDALLKRRGELEARQVALWAQIPFESIAYQEVTDKPLYRYELKASGKQPLDQQHLAAVAAGADFIREIDRVMTQTTSTITHDPAGAIRNFEQHTAAAAKSANDALLKQDLLATELSTTDRPLQQLAAAAKRAAALARNVSDAWQLAADSSAAGDDQAKLQYRGILQNSLLDYASTVMAADASLEQMSRDWKIQPDTSHELNGPESAAAAATGSHASSASGGATTAPTYPADAVAYEGRHFKIFHETLNWNDADQRCKEMGGALAWPGNPSAVKFLQQLKGKNVAAWLGAYRTKEGWRTSDGRRVHKGRVHTTPGDQAATLASDGTLSGRPFDGNDPGAKLKTVTAFICEWDD